jgi:hypothetical protein
MSEDGGHRGRPRTKKTSKAKRVEKSVDSASRSLSQVASQVAMDVAEAVDDASLEIKRRAEDVQKVIERSVPSSYQIGLGLALGGLGGWMDARYIEPFGSTLAASLLTLQILEHEEKLHLPWNATNVRHNHCHGPGRRSSAQQEVGSFAKNNAYLAGSFMAAYFALHTLSGEFK